jgi:putative SOS response-associated peptidase YedK
MLIGLMQRPSQIRRMLEDENMQVWEVPDDEGEGSPRQSYNFAPGYHGVVYRADTPDWGAGPRRERKAADSQAGSEAPAQEADVEEAQDAAGPTENGSVRYKLQSMKWGLIPFWTKRNPDYGSVMKTINCRDDSLSTTGGMWTTMKARKRCIVVAQGFYEWLQKGPKEKVPHYIKRKDGQLLCLAGLWDCVQYEGEFLSPRSRPLHSEPGPLTGESVKTPRRRATPTPSSRPTPTSSSSSCTTACPSYSSRVRRVSARG